MEESIPGLGAVCAWLCSAARILVSPGSGGLCTLVTAFLAEQRMSQHKGEFILSSSAHNCFLIRLNFLSRYVLTIKLMKLLRQKKLVSSICKRVPEFTCTCFSLYIQNCNLMSLLKTHFTYLKHILRSYFHAFLILYGCCRYYMILILLVASVNCKSCPSHLQPHGL